MIWPGMECTFWSWDNVVGKSANGVRSQRFKSKLKRDFSKSALIIRGCCVITGCGIISGCIIRGCWVITGSCIISGCIIRGCCVITGCCIISGRTLASKHLQFPNSCSKQKMNLGCVPKDAIGKSAGNSQIGLWLIHGIGCRFWIWEQFVGKSGNGV